MNKCVYIKNVMFPIEKGLIVLKASNQDKEEYRKLYDAWDEVPDLDFKVALSFKNIEQRRIAIGMLGIDKIVSELKGELVSRETIRKTAMYISPSGDLVNNEYDDTYELYKINGNLLWGDAETDSGRVRRANTDVYFVKMYCTSTNREYLIWVDAQGVKNANNLGWRDEREINSIQAIAWTIQTNVPEGKIEKIIRQGDCIFVKPFPEYYNEERKWNRTRHLTEKEYRELLVAES